MFHKFKITTCAFILCLFGLTLITVSPVLAEDSAAFVECQKIKPNGKDFGLMKEKKNCFKRLARELQAANEAQEPLKTRIGELEKQLSDASEEIQQVEEKISAQVEMVFRADLAAANAAQEPLKTRIDELENQLSDLQEGFRKTRERYDLDIKEHIEKEWDAQAEELRCKEQLLDLKIILEENGLRQVK